MRACYSSHVPGTRARDIQFAYGGRQMAKSKLTKTAETIGTALGRADRTAHQVAKASVVAKEELEALTKEIDALKKRLLKTTKRLQKALS